MIKEKRRQRRYWQQDNNTTRLTTLQDNNTTRPTTTRLDRTIKQYTRKPRQNNWAKYCNDMELSEGHNDAWRKLRSVINPRKRSVYPTLTTTDEHNNVTKHTTTEQKLDAFADQLTKTFTNDGDTTNYDDNWKQTVDAYIDTNSQMLNVLDHLGGNVLHDENRITLPELDAKLKHLNTKKAKGHDRISNKIISYILPSLTPSSIPSTTFLSTAVTILWSGNEPWAC